MASLRSATPSIASIFRFASSCPPPASSSRLCTRCLRAQRCRFSSFRPHQQSSKRALMTETVRPQTLEPEMPPPPRNEGIPETSISAGDQKTWPPTAPWQRTDTSSGTGASERESEAQKSKPTAAATQPQQQQTSSAGETKIAPKKSKLRPRKAPITLTPTAVSQLHNLFNSPEHKMIRVGVKNRGCSGLAYHLEYVDKPGTFDETVEQDGVKVLIDSKALFSIIGSEMDWQEDKLSARFVFRNPNITEQCGCGESFSVG